MSIRPINTNVPPGLPLGLLEAAREGHTDAILDLAHTLKDMGDPRGRDILWRITHRPDYEILDSLYRPTCPRCGNAYPFAQGDIGYACPASLSETKVDGREQLTGELCGWSGPASEMVLPLLVNE